MRDSKCDGCGKTKYLYWSIGNRKMWHCKCCGVKQYYTKDTLRTKIKDDSSVKKVMSNITQI